MSAGSTIKGIGRGLGIGADRAAEEELQKARKIYYDGKISAFRGRGKNLWDKQWKATTPDLSVANLPKGLTRTESITEENDRKEKVLTEVYESLQAYNVRDAEQKRHGNPLSIGTARRSQQPQTRSGGQGPGNASSMSGRYSSAGRNSMTISGGLS